MFKRFALVALFWSATSLSSAACQFDTDCAVGSECVKGFGELYGICAGGSRPGNKYDDKPGYDPLDLDNSYGNTCRFDTDCGVGNVCAKGSGELRGVCVDG